MKKNFLITTGGSGGHVLPAKIIFEHLSIDKNVIISIDRRGLKYLEKDIYKFEVIDTPKLNNIFFLPINLTKKAKNRSNPLYRRLHVFTNNFSSKNA